MQDYRTSHIEDTIVVKTEPFDESFASEGSSNAQCVLFSDEKPYKCDQCDNVFESFSAFELHTQGHDEREVVHNFDTVVSETDPLQLSSYNLVKTDSPEQIEEKPHVCDKCDRIFDNISAFESHVTEHEQDIYICTNCNTMFKSDSELRIHAEQIHTEISMCIKSETEDNEKFRTCEICAKSFTDVHSFQMHVLTHTVHNCTEILESITCSKCDLSFGNRNSFQNHKCGKPHMCELCNKSFQLKSVLDSHICTHSDRKANKHKLCSQSYAQGTAFQKLHSGTNSKQYTCEICNGSFSKEKTFHSHGCADTVKNPHTCQTCNKSFETNIDFQVHIYNGHGNPISCKICNKLFTNRKTFHSHVCTDGSEEPYTCKICNESFTEEITFYCHVCTIDIVVKPYTCKICKTSFTEEKFIHSHICSDTSRKRFICHICNKCFGREVNLLKHINAHRNPYTCKICNSSFTEEKTFRSHVCTDTVIKPYACQTCNKYFETETFYLRHISNAHQHSCQVCNISFAIKEELTCHMGTHHTSPKQYRPKCKIYGKSFVKESSETHFHTYNAPGETPYGKSFIVEESSKTHFRTYNAPGVRPYTCDFCKKSFRTKCSLKYHVTTHTDVKQYCEICNKYFPLKHRLVHHIQSVVAVP